MSGAKTNANWFIKHAEAEAKKDVIPFSEGIGNIIGIVVTILVVLFFAFHQMQSTGFFTSSFGTTEMLLFYLSIMAGMVTAIVTALFGRKNPARLFDMLGAASSPSPSLGCTLHFRSISHTSQMCCLIS